MINEGSAYHQGPANSGIAEELEPSKAAVGLENVLGNNDCGGFVTSDNVDEFVFLNLGVVYIDRIYSICDTWQELDNRWWKLVLVPYVSNL